MTRVYSFDGGVAGTGFPAGLGGGFGTGVVDRVEVGVAAVEAGVWGAPPDVAGATGSVPGEVADAVGGPSVAEPLVERAEAADVGPADGGDNGGTTTAVRPGTEPPGLEEAGAETPHNGEPAAAAGPTRANRTGSGELLPTPVEEVPPVRMTAPITTVATAPPVRAASADLRMAVPPRLAAGGLFDRIPAAGQRRSTQAGLYRRAGRPGPEKRRRTRRIHSAGCSPRCGAPVAGIDQGTDTTIRKVAPDQWAATIDRILAADVDGHCRALLGLSVERPSHDDGIMDHAIGERV